MHGAKSSQKNNSGGVKNVVSCFCTAAGVSWNRAVCKDDENEANAWEKFYFTA